MKKDRFEVENYADVLAVAYDLEVVSFEEDGGYQGDYLAVLTDGERLFYFIDSYGSCCGCDWLYAERDWEDDTISYTKAIEYINDVKPKYIVPKDRPLEFEKLGEYEGFKLKTLTK